MIKRCFLIILFIAGATISQGQDFKQYIFKDKKVCSFSHPKDSIFLKVDSTVRQMFFMDKITAIQVTETCGRTIRTGLYSSSLEIDYPGNFALQAFDSLVVHTKSFRSSLWDYNKPGKIYGLSKTKKSISVISMNSCANYPDFEKVIDTIRKQKYFDRILVVPCGADPRSAQVFW